MTDTFDLRGRQAYITGAVGLLGLHHCEALLEKGCNITLIDINEDLLRQAVINLQQKYSSSHVDYVHADITNYQELDEKLKCSEYSKLILINNAAVNPKVEDGSTNLGQFESCDPKKIISEFEVSIIGAINCCKILGSQMKKNNNGVILNIASDLSIIAPDQRLYNIPGLPDERQPKKPVSYSICKSGLVGLSKYLSTYWSDNKIRVNSLSPVGVFDDQPIEFVANLSSRIPLGRMARSDEYKGAVQFLCSDASSYMTGQNIVMDGGRSVW